MKAVKLNSYSLHMDKQCLYILFYANLICVFWAFKFTLLWKFQLKKQANLKVHLVASFAHDDDYMDIELTLSADVSAEVCTSKCQHNIYIKMDN